MWTHKRPSILYVLLFGLLLTEGKGRAEDAPTAESTKTVESPAASSGPSRLAGNLNQLMKSANHVTKTEEGVVYVNASQKSFAKDTEILFVRKKGIHIEMIANGRVAGEQVIDGKPQLIVQLSSTDIVKLPQSGDLAVAITAPMVSDNADKNENNNLLKPKTAEEKEGPPDSGYLEVASGLMFGHMTSAPSTIANYYKSPNRYRFMRTQIQYYSEYIPVGIEYSWFSGNFPTSTFYLNTVLSDESISTLKLQYRFRPLWGFLRFSPQVLFLNDRFHTNNTDENLMTTQYSGTGFGLKTTFEFVDNIWVPKGKFPLSLQQIFADISYIPSLNAQDEGESGTGTTRGTSSDGSTGLEYGIGMKSMLFLSFMPWVKRIVFEGGYRIRSYSLKFSGATIKEPGGPDIPENTTSSEKESYYYFAVGIRIEDPVKLMVDLVTGKNSKK